MGRVQETLRRIAATSIIAGSTFAGAHTETRFHRPTTQAVKITEVKPLLKEQTLFVGSEQSERIPEQLSQNASLEEHIRYFDRNWQSEGLPTEWYKLGENVGFSMKSQMTRLKDTSAESLAPWKQESSYLISGFTLEYLSKHVVYPCKYERNPNDPTKIGDPAYGYTDMVEIISEKERKGSVKQAVREAKAYLENAPVGAIVVMTSPFGDTGLQTDDHEAIEYPDSYFFLLHKDGEGKDFHITNYTIKTDFTYAECREVIYQLTGKLLDPTAPLEEYVTAIAKINPEEHEKIKSINDAVKILESVRKTPYIYKNVPFANVYNEIAQGEELYQFSQETQRLKRAFKGFCDRAGYDKLMYQKALAATILLVSEHELRDPHMYKPNVMTVYQHDSSNISYYPRKTFGNVLQEVSERPGCAGGGKKVTSVSTMGGDRGALVRDSDILSDSDEPFTCPSCKQTADGPVGNTCPNCGLTKEKYVEDAQEAGKQVCI